MGYLSRVVISFEIASNVRLRAIVIAGVECLFILQYVCLS